MGASNRSIVEERLAEALESRAGAKLTVEWRNQSKHLPVIEMDVNLLYYNPGTHRIRAQRAVDPVRDRELDENPWGAESQEYLHKLLKSRPSNPDQQDPDFDALMLDLKEFGQNEPGIITYDGVLVNGNTRRAVLKELGRPYISVAVLPETTTWADISSVELALQLRKDHRRDYSYINFLLALEEQVKLGRAREDIVRQFRIRPTTFDQARWILELIHEVMERSKVGGASLRAIDFEDHQEKLKELHRAYVKLSAADRDAAEVLRENRILAIVLDFAKTDVRFVEEDFQAKYLNKRLPAGLVPAAEAASPVGIPGLGVAVPGAAPEVRAARALTDVVLQAKAVSVSREPVGAYPSAEAASTLNAVKSAVDKALQPAGRDVRLRKRKQAAPERLSDACDNIDQCVADLAVARASRSLDEEAFDEGLLRLRESLLKLARQASRIGDAQGDGMLWLLEALKER
jgi:hypothetical protein